MEQINLLKQTGSPSNLKDIAPKYSIRIFLAILGLLVAYYAWLLFDFRHTQNKIFEQRAAVEKGRQESLSVPGRDELLTRQSQVNNLQPIIAQHTYWSQLFAELARVTLKTAGYSSLKADALGNLNLNVTVPSLADFDKYSQVFDVSD